MINVIARYLGDRMSTRVIHLTNGRFGVQYEYSKIKDHWRTPLDKGNGYETLNLARAAARRLLKANN